MEKNVNPLKWFTLPPAVALFTVLVVSFLGTSKEGTGNVDPSLWILAGLLFMVLTVLYSLFIRQGYNAGLVPVQLVAQGLLLCPLALTFGAPMLQWVGVAMAVSGAIILTTLYQYRRPEREGAVVPENIGREIELPVPFVITDDQGMILKLSDPMAEIAGLPPKELLGEGIAHILTPGEEETELGGKTWKVRQYPMEDNQFYFQLSEPPEKPKSFAASDNPFIDSVTNLHTCDYAMRRLEDELYRTRRYNHPLTAALMRLVFPPASEKDRTADQAFEAYCRLVRNHMRATDTVALVAPRDLLLVFPEAVQEAAEPAMNKLGDLFSPLYSDYPILYDVTILRVMLSYEAGDEIPSSQTVLKELEKEMVEKYTLTD